MTAAARRPGSGRPATGRLRWCIPLLAALALAACASGPAQLQPGASAAEIDARFGKPVASYPLPGGGRQLEFAKANAQTTMVQVDAAGRMVRTDQVLTEANLKKIVGGMSTEHVLMTIGHPAERRRGGRQGGEVWSYHYRNSFCLWFQVSIGDDGRTLGRGEFLMRPACLNAQ
jgi:hypothetical protein